MLQVSQSAFLQALGFAIINSLWQFALLWLVYLLINSVVKLSSHKKYATALSLHFAGFSWFIATAILFYKQCREAGENLGAWTSADLFVAFTLKNNIINAVSKAEQLLPYLSLAYIILLVFFAIRTIQSYRNTQRVRNSGLQKINVEWRLFVQKLAGQLGIKRPVKIYLSNLVQGPVAIGFLKPLILLPFSLINNLSTEQIEAVLLHELAHVKRNDYFINLIISIIEITLFFNPFTRLMSTHIKRERENSCDDWVLQYQYNATSYASALLTIAKTRITVPHLAMSAVEDNNHALLMRVKRMIEKNDRSFNYRGQLIALVFITVIISSAAFLTPAKRVSTIAKNNTHVPFIEAEPLAQKNKNASFNNLLAAFKKQRGIEKVTTKTSSSIIVSNEPINESIDNAGEDVVEEIAEPAYTQHAALSIPDNLFFNAAIDTAVDVDTKYIQTAAAVVDLKKVAEDYRQAAYKAGINKLNDLVRSQKIQQQLQEALTQLNHLDIVINTSIAKLISKAATLKTISEKNKLIAEEKAKKVELNKIKTAVEQQLNEVKQQNAALAKLQTNTYADLEIPGAVYTPNAATTQEEPWSYTYKVSPDAKVTYTTPAQAGAPSTKQITGEEKQEEIIITITPAHGSEAKKVQVKKVIKIVRI